MKTTLYINKKENQQGKERGDSEIYLRAI